MRVRGSCAGRSPTRRNGPAAPTSRWIRGSRAPGVAARAMRCAKASRRRTATGAARPAVPITTATSTRREISSRKVCAYPPHNGRRDPVRQCAWRVTRPGCSRFDPGVVRYPMKREQTLRGQGGMQPPKPREEPTPHQQGGSDFPVTGYGQACDRIGNWIRVRS